MNSRPLVPWWAAVLVAACLVVMAVDTSHLPGFPDWYWLHSYITTAGLFLAWRWRLQPWMLHGAALVLFVTSFARAATFLAFDPLDRAAGAAINVLLALLALDMTTSGGVHSERTS